MSFLSLTYQLEIWSPSVVLVLLTHQEQSQEASYAVDHYYQISANISNMSKSSEVFVCFVLFFGKCSLDI